MGSNNSVFLHIMSILSHSDALLPNKRQKEIKKNIIFLLLYCNCRVTKYVTILIDHRQIQL